MASEEKPKTETKPKAEDAKQKEAPKEVLYMQCLPLQLQPCLYIETCKNCNSHNWHVQAHREVRYVETMKQLCRKVIQQIPYFGEDGGHIMLNMYDTRLTQRGPVFYKNEIIRNNEPLESTKLAKRIP